MLNQEQQAKIIKFVVAIHEGQYDKTDRPYTEHLFRVADAFEPGSYEWIVAMLHDALEDNRCTVEDLIAYGIPEICIQALHLLNHDKSEKYYIYIRRIKLDTTPAGILARKVKISDILDNDDPARLFYLSEDQRYRLLMKYHRALKDLLL